MNFQFVLKASAVDRGLNRCAALLSNILDNEDKGEFYLFVLFHILSGIFDGSYLIVHESYLSAKKVMSDGLV